MSHEFTTTLLKTLLEAYASKTSLPSDFDTDNLELKKLILRNRLESIAYHTSNHFNEWGEKYQQRSLAGYRILKSGSLLTNKLNKENIPCFTMRGPFDTLEIYGDIAARVYRDIDLYIQKKDTRKAWHLFKEEGYTLIPQMPKSFLLRNHLNWAFINHQTQLRCDLHWAIDHPYNILRVDYNSIFEQLEKVTHNGISWHKPNINHWIILTALHSLKHVPNAWDIVQDHELGLINISEKAQLKYWLDVAMLLHRKGNEIDWDFLLETTEKWKTEKAVSSIITGCEKWFNAKISKKTEYRINEWTFLGLFNKRISDQNKNFRKWIMRHLNAFSKAGGFGWHRTWELEDYISPPDYYFNTYGKKLKFAKSIHAIKAVARLIIAMFDLFISYYSNRAYHKIKRFKLIHQKNDATPGPIKVLGLLSGRGLSLKNRS